MSSGFLDVLNLKQNALVAVLYIGLECRRRELDVYSQRSQRATRGEVLKDGSQSFHGHLADFDSTLVSKK